MAPTSISNNLISLSQLNSKYNITVIINNNSIKIIDGYKIRTKKKKKQILKEILHTYEGIVFKEKRSIKSFLREWQAHNVLYKLGLFKSHTKDTDLDNDESKFRRFCYFFLSILGD